MWNPHLTLFSKSKVANTREIDMLESYRFMQLHNVLSSSPLSEFKSNMNQKLMKSVPKLGIESNLVGYESKVY